MGLLVHLPGLIDPHVHLREPGAQHKEDIESGTAAALAGGMTAVLMMPNTDPPITDARRFRQVETRAAAMARCDWGIFLGATPDNAGFPPDLQKRAAGLKIYVDDTYGPLRITDDGAIRRHLESWKGPGPVAMHAEGGRVSDMIRLVRQTGARTHFCHISRKREIAAIRAAKEEGLPVTCEVTPHHLFLTEADARRLGAFADMRPPLAGEANRLALWDNLDVVDCVASDHAPHTVDEKRGEDPPPGVPGLETTLLLMADAVARGALLMTDLVRLLHIGPREIYRLPAREDSRVAIEIGESCRLPDEGWFSRCGWSPFSGVQVNARLQNVVAGGALACENGVVLATTGSGRHLRKDF